MPRRRPPWPTPNSKATAGRPTGSNAGTSSGRWTNGQIRAIKEALAHGHPVACGLRWPKVLKGSELIQVPPPNAVEDGHSIALVGYIDDAERQGRRVPFPQQLGTEVGQRRLRHGCRTPT